MKKATCVYMTLAALSGVSLFAATTRYVIPPTAGNVPVPPYTSWDTAANDIATAILESGNGDTILVAQGTYSVGATINADKPSLKIKSCNRATGEQDRENTILDGGGKTTIMELNAQAVEVHGLTFANGCIENEIYSSTAGGAAIRVGANDVVIDDCIFRGNVSVNANGTCISSENRFTTITGCVFTNNMQTINTAGKAVKGGAVHFRNTAPNWKEEYWPRISDCVFDGNSATGPFANGSVVNAGGSTVFDACVFLTNSFTQTDSTKDTMGAYVYVGTNTTMRNCRFSCKGFSNSEGGYVYGTVLSISGYGCSFSNVTFSSMVEDRGKNLYGTIVVNGNSAKFLDCKFMDNMLWSSSLLWLHNTGDALFRNCIFAGNDRNTTCRLIRRYGETTAPFTGLTVENCTFVDNTDSVAPLQFHNANYNNYIVNTVFTTDNILSADTTASVIASNSCFTVLQSVGGLSFNDKCFTVARGGHKFVDEANGDCHLKARSPLRDKGVMLSWMTSASKDPDGNSRVFGPLPDVGCYECCASYPGFKMTVR